MSSYLNFYLVPKSKEDTKESKPLLFLSYSRSSDIYQAFCENIHPTFIGNGEEYQYSELTKEDIQYVVNETKKDLNKVEASLQGKIIDAIKEINNLNSDIVDNYVEDYVSTKEYINELKDTINDLEFIDYIVSDLEYSDFEKVLMNIS